MIWDSDDNMLSDPSGSVGANATVAVSGGDGMIPKFEVDVEGGNGEVELGLEQEQKNKEKGKEVREAVDTHSLARLATDSTIPKEEVKSLFGSSIFGGESGGEESQGYATNTSLLLGNWSSEVFGSTYSWVSQSAAPQMVMASSGCACGDPSSCRECFVRTRSHQLCVPRGGQSRGEDSKNKKRKARRQLWGDGDSYPYPPRRNRRFSGSGSMEMFGAGAGGGAGTGAGEPSSG